MRKTTCYIQRMNLDLYYPPHIKINLKWIKYLTIGAKTVKILEKKIGESA